MNRLMRPSSEIDTVWAELATGDDRPLAPAFDPDTLESLPDPAKRWLTRVLPAGTPLAETIELSMTGEIKIGSRWMPFEAKQVLRAGVGFVWQPVVGRRLVRFKGADVLGPSAARMEFRLHGLLPIVKATGPDIALSGAGRLAAETAVWLPQATTPQAGARWTAIDDDTVTVSLDAAGHTIDVQLTVAADGRLDSLSLQRWNSGAQPPAYQGFGGDVTSEYALANGVLVAGSGPVGWGYGTRDWDDGVFFHYQLKSAALITPHAGA